PLSSQTVPAPTVRSTLSLHDALPISPTRVRRGVLALPASWPVVELRARDRAEDSRGNRRQSVSPPADQSGRPRGDRPVGGAARRRSAVTRIGLIERADLELRLADVRAHAVSG